MADDSQSSIREDLEKAADGEQNKNKFTCEYWKDEFAEADKRLEKYHKKGDKIVERFLDYRGDDPNTEASGAQFRLNLFNAHVSMLLAMLYGRVPQTDARRRWEDANDDAGRVGAEILRRVLNTSIEAPGADVPSVLRACLQDRLLPGHGIARVRYTFTTKAEDNPDYDPERGEDDLNPKTVDVTDDEEAPVDYVHWRDFKWGFGRLWKDVPWVAFRAYMSEEDATKRFGKQKASQLEFNTKKIAENGMMQDVSRGTIKEAEVWEIWNKEDRKVYFFSESCDELLDTKEDPLGLEGFVPCPEPLIANPTTTLYRPTPDWQISQDLYNEIDILQTRISIITKAVRVVGVYDQQNGSLQRMLKEGTENDLIPVDNWAAFAERGGIRGTVDWFPVEEVVNALNQLKDMLQSTVEMLYQVTGLSDILRGAAGPDRESAASAGQRARFASIRVQHLQEEFARFASDLMTLRAQIICRHWEVDTIAKKANLENFMEPEENLMAGMDLLKSGYYTWPWKIEIKPESVAMIDYAQLQNERVEYLNAVATYLQSAHGMITAVPGSAPALIAMLKWGLAGFKGSQQIEGVLDQAMDAAIQALNQPGQGDSEMANKMTEIQAKSRAKMQEQAQKHEQEMEKLEQQFMANMQELMAETESAVIREKMQAHYNIMEKRVAERIEAKKRAQKEKDND